MDRWPAQDHRGKALICGKIPPPLSTSGGSRVALLLHLATKAGQEENPNSEPTGVESPASRCRERPALPLRPLATKAGWEKLRSTSILHQEVATSHGLIEGYGGPLPCPLLQPLEKQSNEEEP